MKIKSHSKLILALCGFLLFGIAISGAAAGDGLVFAWNTAAQVPDPAKRLDAVPELGAGASLHGKPVFPADNPWNQDISAAPVDPNSAKLITSIGLNTTLHPDFGTAWEGVPNGIPYIVVSGTQKSVPWDPLESTCRHASLSIL